MHHSSHNHDHRAVGVALFFFLKKNFSERKKIKYGLEPSLPSPHQPGHSSPRQKEVALELFLLPSFVSFHVFTPHL
jgi:hypothetical protein